MTSPTISWSRNGWVESYSILGVPNLIIPPRLPLPGSRLKPRRGAYSSSGRARRQFTDTCRVAGSPGDGEDARHTFGAHWVGRIVFYFRMPQCVSPTEAGAPRFAAEAAARHVPLKQQSSTSVY